MQRKFIITTFVLSLLVFIATVSHAQSDAFFYEMETERDPDVSGFNFNNFDSPQGLGFNFGGFNGYGGNGFSFDDFANDEGSGFSFGNFNHTPDNVPLGSGLLLLTGFALLWKKRKD